MKALLIGGGGTLGEYAAVELLKNGWSVDVLAPEELTNLNRRLRYFCGLADDTALRELFAANRYEVVGLAAALLAGLLPAFGEVIFAQGFMGPL